MKTKPTMTDGEAMRKIKDLLARDGHAAIMSERKRINKETVPRFTALFTGLKLKYIETGETAIITEVGELFETIRARFPNGEVLWCSPEEFALIEQRPGRENRMDKHKYLFLTEATRDIAPGRLMEICDAERDGRLVRLPCKVGDTVYRIISYKCNAVCNKLNACNSFIYKGCKQAEFYVCSGTFQLNDMWWIGKTVFLTRAEAEAALQKEAQHE